MSHSSTFVAGIDTGKAALDLAVTPGEGWLRVNNDAAGWQAAAEWLLKAGVDRVGIEASGGYERGVVAALREAGFKVILHQPLQVRLFARMRLQRAKNDRLDARVIAAFTALFQTSRAAVDPALSALNEHLVFIDQLVQDIARLKTRLEHLHDTRLASLVAADIAALKARLRDERRRLERAVRADKALGRRLDLLLSVPGIGIPTALALLIAMPELGSISREQAAALIGLAPFDHDSGKHHGRRHIAGGRARPRQALYAAALPAAYRWNRQLMALYARLTAAGKPHKLALVACARKLVIFANTVLQRGQPWTP
ncbi:IS110 family transposase [Devosia albogilva]|uniref:IS110 family transposase n=1 Tax=Devosia albogilva TaxID=429726 RepID=A0ABW5QLX1_9HYPH